MTETPYLTTAEAADIVRCRPDTIAKLCKGGALVGQKVGSGWRVHRDDLETFMRKGQTAPPARRRRRAS